jgi:general secretion pathway protein L
LADTLVIRIPDSASETVEWVAVGAAGSDSSASQSGTLKDAAALASNRRLVVLVPSTRVLRINARIPLKGAARIRQALPFALEEQLAGDIDQQHFAFRAKDDAGSTPVAVVEKQLLQEWIDRLDAAGLMPNAIYADSDALPSIPATITLLIEGDRALIRSDEGEVTAFDEGSLETVLELLLDAQAQKLENDATAVPVNLLVYCSDEARQRYEQLWDRQRMRVENLELKILPNGALPLLAGEIAQRAGVNLLQGNFAPKSELPIKWQDWRLAATLLAGFLVLNLAYKGAQLWQLNRADSALDAAALEVFQRAFPAAGEVNDPWNELRSRLGTEDGDSSAPEQTDLSESLEALSAAFAQTPGIRMETLSFRGGELDLQLTAPDVAALDRLRQLISEAGKFTAEIQSANPDEDLIKGRIQITAAGDS